MGTLIQKIQCQSIPSVMAPPISGPEATASPARPPYTPMIMARRSGGKAAVKMVRLSASTMAPPPGPARERALVRRFTHAYETGDVREVVALLTDDAWLIMPPIPLHYQGREQATRFLAATGCLPGRPVRLVPTRANGQPAFGVYLRDPHAPIAHAHGILVLTLAGSQISAMTGFAGNSALRIFGLPRTLPD